MTDNAKINVYFVKTELEFLCSKLICLKINHEETNLLYYYSERFDSIVDPSEWSLTGCLFFSRKFPFPDRQKSLQKCLHRVADDISSLNPRPEKICLHMHKIPSSATNYQINFLRRYFKNAHVCVHLIPHGAGDFAEREKTFIRKLKLFSRKCKLSDVLFKDISYYVHRGDWHGTEDEIVERVYILNQAPKCGPAEKIYELPRFNVLGDSQAEEKSINAALIVGQNLSRKDRLFPGDLEKVSAAIRSFLEPYDLDVIHYSRHPRSKGKMELFDDSFEVLDHKGPVELVLIDTPYKVVVSCYSTVLLNAKLILGKEARVASIGFNLANIEKEAIDRMTSAFVEAGVEVVDV